MRLVHEVTILRSTAGAVDDYNQPSQTFAATKTVRAWIQPKSGEELAQVNEAGPVRGEYRIFMLPLDVTEGDYIIRVDTGDVYQIGFIADAAGVGHHLEIDASRLGGFA